MAGPAEILRSWLVDQGLVLMPSTLGRTIPIVPLPGDNKILCYVSSLPDEIDQAVRLKDTGGLNFGKSQKDGKSLIHPGVQVFIRFPDSSGYDLAESIAVALDKLKRVSTILNGVTHYIQSVPRIGTIVDLGEEIGRKRQQWVFNTRIAFQDAEPSLG